MELCTLVRSLEDAAKVDPSRGYTFISDAGVPGFGNDKASENTFSYPTIERTSARIGGALQALGLKKGDRLAIILPTNEDFVLTFFGALRAGIVPVPIYPPMALGQLQSYLDNTRHIVAKSGAVALITTAQIKRLLGTVQEASPALRQIVAIENVREASDPFRPVDVAMDDVAFLQFTSGSTSRPKGVALTHANLAHNIKCIMHDGLHSNGEDVGMSWLPLFHDMGLIGFVLAPLVYQVPVAFLPALTFLKRPVTWFQAMTRHKGSIGYAPNFAYALSVKRIRESELEGIDLSRWRIAGCGAEPIRAETLETFAQTFAKVGFSANALLPSYGMAESSLAVAFTELGEGIKTVSVDGERLWSEGQAHEVAGDAESAVRLVSCGEKFQDHAFAVFANDDAESTTALPEGKVGEIRIQGPSVMKGYWDDAEKTQAAFAGGWLRTGDLGFVLRDKLYICGRSKEVIIVNGRNYYPQDIEWEASKVPGVRKGNVIAFGSRGQGDKERVIVAFEMQQEPGSLKPEELASKAQELGAAVRASIQDGLHLTVDDCVGLAPGVLPKTSSGKLQRAKTRELYENDELSGRKGARDENKLGLVKEAAKSQLSFLKLAVLGKTKK